MLAHELHFWESHFITIHMQWEILEQDLMDNDEL